MFDSKGFAWEGTNIYPVALGGFAAWAFGGGFDTSFATY
jgi:hypothetical protein